MLRKRSFGAALLLLLSAGLALAQNPSCPRTDCPNQGQCQCQGQCPGTCPRNPDGSCPRQGQNQPKSGNNPERQGQNRGGMRSGLGRG